MKSPAVLFYTSDFLTGVMFMSNEQVGKYIKLLCMQHQQGHLNEEDFFSICNRNDKKIIEKFLIDKNGNYFNKRMEEETEKRNNYSKSRSLNRQSKPSNIKKKPKKDMKNICKSYDKHMENDNDNDNVNIYYNNKELNSIFIEYLNMRKKLKMINSDRAITTLMNKLSNYDDKTKYKMIEQSIVKSWKSVYEVKEETLPEWFNNSPAEEHLTEAEEQQMKERLKKYEK